MGWSREGTWLNAVDGDGQVIQIPTFGGETTAVLAPATEDAYLRDLTPDASLAAAEMWTASSDLWIIDGFDPNAD